MEKEIRADLEKFEKENDVSISHLVAGKTKFEFLNGIYSAFKIYEKKIEEIESQYISFFYGSALSKINPDYTKIIYNCNWFLERITSYNRFLNGSLSKEQKEKCADFVVDVSYRVSKCLKFNVNHHYDFKCYLSYFACLNSNHSSNDELYISFTEFKNNFDKIEKMDRDKFVQWAKARDW